MAVQIECSGCKAHLKVAETALGKHIRCPKCQAVIKVDPIGGTSTNPDSPVRTRSDSSDKVSALRSNGESPYSVPTSRREDSQKPAAPKRNSHTLVAVLATALMCLVGVAVFVAYRMGTAARAVAAAPGGVPVTSNTAPAQSDTEIPSPASGEESGTQSNAAETVAAVPPSVPTTNPSTSASPAPAPVPPPVLPEAAATEIQFELMALDEPATSFALTEDGRFAVFTHQSANSVSVYDVPGDKLVTQVSTTSPRSILCRGDQVIVANSGEGRISVFSIAGGWRLTHELNVPKKSVLHLSAACGAAFGGELLVTCHEKSEDGNSTEYFVYLADLSKDSCKLIGRVPLALVSFDGRIVLTQQSFNQSPSGGIEAFAYEDFMGGDPTRIYAGGIQQTPFVYQPSPGGIWFAENMVFGGTPIAQVHKDLGKILIPDLMQKVAYTCDGDTLEARIVNSAMTPMDKKPRRVVFPDIQKKEPSRLFNQLNRRRSYLLDRPWAVTHGSVLTIFMMDQTDGNILRARTKAFETPAAPPAGSTAAVTPAITVGTETVGREHPKPVDAPESLSSAPMADPAIAPDAGSANTVQPATRSDVFADWPALLAAGKTFEYGFPVSDNFSIELQSGPRGMTLTNGVLKWTPADSDAGSIELKLRITERSVPRFERPKVEVVTEAFAKTVNGDLKRINNIEKLDLDVDTLAICDGNGEEDSLILQGQTLRLVGKGSLSNIKTKTLPARYHDIAQRGNTWVAVSSKPPFLDVIDQRSMKVLHHHELKFRELEIHEITDLAVHPSREISYVCVRYNHELPRYTVLIIDDRTGEAADSGIFGTWAEVSPDGQTLFTGYRDIYERGVRFHINPDWRLIEIPEYGNVDMLLAWNIGGNVPKLTFANRSAGGNGKGIRLSPNGDRIVYLSHTGARSGNLEGVSTENFESPPVVYPTKDRCSTTEAAFHPFLPWIACPAERHIQIFDTNTGDTVENRVLATADGLGGDPIERLFFSVDGKTLLLVRGGGDAGRYLQQIPLAVTPEELRPKRPRRQPSKTKSRTDEPLTVQASKLDVLSGRANTKEMNAEEIAKDYMDSVAIVLCGESAGTGFVVGDEGYLLTCEHVVDSAGPVTVHFRSPKGDGTFVSLPAEIIRTDEHQDIALLRCATDRKLKSVKLRPKDDIGAGEPVTVIGNPGAGETLLSHTMTTGIVSNPRRMISDVAHIQLSAAVNPGNSGGPMFDKHGNVAGLIALKANIEGASFAVPASALREFLEAATRKL